MDQGTGTYADAAYNIRGKVPVNVMTEKRLAVLFPGIGYHTDKPLLYYSGKMAAAEGYEIIKISYPPCEVNLKGATREQILAFVKECVEVTDRALQEAGVTGADATEEEAADTAQYDDILFISKSIGTAIAAAYANTADTDIRHIFFTPLEETFDYVKESSGIAFSGTKDNWADHGAIRRLCSEKKIPLTVVDDANHSLETGDVIKDTEMIAKVMKTVKEYLK